MRENTYQQDLIKTLRRMFPGIIILKNDSSYMQGIPDLLLLLDDQWAMLEVKPKKDAVEQPNQDWWVTELNSMSFAAFIYPENEEEVLDALQQLFTLER